MPEKNQICTNTNSAAAEFVSGFVISHFSFDLRNFYFVFSKEAVKHKTLKHTFLTELVNNVT